MPVQIANNIIARLYGSLTAVLNLITDNAPTSPRDSANEVLTTAIKEATLTTTIRMVLPKEIFEEYVIENLLYKNLMYKPNIKDIKSIHIPSKKLNWIDTRVS